MKLFSIFDSKAKIFNTPFAQRTTADAIRGFQTAAKDRESNIGRYPEDFILYLVGEFDDEKGELLPYATASSIARATEFTA